MRVPSLFKLAAKAVENNFFNVANSLLKDETTSFIDLAEQLGRLAVQVQDTPASLHPEITGRCLSAAQRLSKAKCSKKRKFAIEHIISIVNRLKIEKIFIDFHAEKSSTQLYTAFGNLLTKTNQPLRLQCYLFRRSAEISNLSRQQFIESCPNWVNLVSFSSNCACDEIVRALCENCPSIQELYLMESEITNSCISSMIRFKKLQKVDFLETSVSAEGYVQLLLHAQALIDIGAMINNISKVLNQLKKDVVPVRPFELRRLEFFSTDFPDLQLIAKFFPKVTELEMEYSGDDGILSLAPDLSALDKMKHVKKARLEFSVHPSYDLMNLRSGVLTNLDIALGRAYSHSLKVDIIDIMKIGIQCPNIGCLNLGRFQFSDTMSLEFYHLLGRPFPKLKHLSLWDCSNLFCLRVILNYTACIESIHIHISGKVENLTDLFEHVLRANPLERLKSLKTWPENNIPAYLLKKIVTQCTKLSDLGDFRTFVALTENEKQEIKHLIIKRL